MSAGIDLKRALRKTDLSWRLEQLPKEAAVRGAFFNMLDERAREVSPELQASYRRYFKTYEFSTLRFYSCKDYLLRLVVLANAAFDDPYRGIRVFQAAAFPAWRRTLIGRSWFALFGSDFRGVLRQMCSTFTSVANYCSAELVENSEPLVVRFRRQYVYIEHAMLGAIEGVARACDQPVRLSVQLVDPFNGDVIVQRPGAELSVLP